MLPRLVEHELNEDTLVALIKYAKYILWVHYRGVMAETEQKPAGLAPEHESAE
ncbi:MAG: hypothetical protein H6R26_206 [Proteobacteria bacterium]|nr:hypothetical protein [Pseudomonadota bacterium]